MKIAATRRVYALGVTLLVALSVCSRHFGDRGGLFFMAALTIAGIAYLLAMREFFRSPEFPRKVLVFGLVFAAVWHVEFLRLPAGSDDDVHRYVWDGRLQRLGYNPYLVIPSDPAVSGLHTSETLSLNNPDFPTPYPAGAQMFFRAVTAIHESTLAFKAAFVICDWAIAFLLLDLLRRTGQGTHLVLAYAWNPLLAIEVAGSGHIDIVGALLLVLSAAAVARRWRAAAAVALALAISVKFLPLVLLPLYWRRVRFRDAALAIAMVALLYVPFLHQGHISIGSLGTYVQTFRFNGPVFAALHQRVAPQLLTAIAVLFGLGTAVYLRRTRHDFCSDAFAWPMAASLFCAPAVFPWYLLWLLPFLTRPATILLGVWTVSITSVYIMWHLRSLTGVWGSLPVWVMVVEYGCVAVAGAVLIIRPLMRRTIEDSRHGTEARLGDDPTTI